MNETVVTIQTEIPKDVYAVLKANGVFREGLSLDVKHMLALRYFQTHKLSLGQSAKLADMSTWAFIEFLSANNVAVVDLDQEELQQEFAQAEKIISELL